MSSRNVCLEADIVVYFQPVLEVCKKNVIILHA